MTTYDEPAPWAPSGTAVAATASAVTPSGGVAPAAAPPGYELAAGYQVPAGYELPQQRPGLLSRIWDRGPRWTRPALVGGVIAAAVVYTIAVHPTTAPSTCLFRILTGFDCPGCGGTRSAWYLLHGDLPAAARHHAPFVFAVPFLLYMYFAWVLRTIAGWRVPTLRLSPAVLMIFLAAWLVYSVLRNLPWTPFTWLYV